MKFTNADGVTHRTNLERRFRIRGIILSVVLLLAACGGSRQPAPATMAGLQADFEASCPFGSLQAGGSQGYECTDGEFRVGIDNNQAPYDFITAPLGGSYGDVRVEVDVRFAQGADAGAYIICRGSQAAGDFYLLRLGVDGSVEITDFRETEEQIARMNSLPEGYVLPGWNHMQADCAGPKLSLTVNGELVLEREIGDDYFASGDVGLGAGGGSFGLSEVRFDNFKLSNP